MSMNEMNVANNSVITIETIGFVIRRARPSTDPARRTGSTRDTVGAVVVSSTATSLRPQSCHSLWPRTREHPHLSDAVRDRADLMSSSIRVDDSCFSLLHE